MTQTNDFDLFIGLVLARLYDDRPKRLAFEVSDFLDPSEKDGSYDEERSENWVNTMFWLIAEGYIREQEVYSGKIGECFDGVELTEKGFRALNSLPSQLGGGASKKSFGSQLIDAGKKAGWKAANNAAEKGANEATRQAAHSIGEIVKNFFI